MWTDARPAGSLHKRVKEWSQSVVQRAALAGPGQSARQMARRIKSWTGVTQRDLQGLGQSERLFATMHDAIGRGDIDWADVATAAGFSDQAHMIRSMRLNTGFTPEQLRQRARTDEAFWSYRLLAEYFARPTI